VGYAWRETADRNGERIDSEVMRVFVSQLQRCIPVEARTDVARPATSATVVLLQRRGQGEVMTGTRDI
jgi:hypothetical protein